MLWILAICAGGFLGVGLLLQSLGIVLQKSTLWGWIAKITGLFLFLGTFWLSKGNLKIAALFVGSTIVALVIGYRYWAKRYLQKEKE